MLYQSFDCILITGVSIRLMLDSTGMQAQGQIWSYPSAVWSITLHHTLFWSCRHVHNPGKLVRTHIVIFHGAQQFKPYDLSAKEEFHVNSKWWGGKNNPHILTWNVFFFVMMKPFPLHIKMTSTCNIIFPWSTYKRVFRKWQKLFFTCE